MSAGDLLSVLLGVGILAFVISDIFFTVLHHWGKSGPLGRAVTHALWRVSLRLTRGLPPVQRRHRLGMVGPTLIPIIVAVWALLVVVGFAFLYLPGIPGAFDRWGRALPVGTAFGDAFYFSGYTFFTLGYGDIAPVTGTMRVLAVVQAGAGFALITLVISYFVSVYDAYTHKTQVADSLFHQAGESADAAVIASRHLAGDGTAVSLTDELRRLRDAVVKLRADYSNYPILHFFRDPKPHQSYLRILFVSQELSCILDTVPDPGRRPELTGLGIRLGLSGATDTAQRALLESMGRQVPEEVEEQYRPRSREEERWRERHLRALRTLREAGVPVREDRAGAGGEYCRRRTAWEPALRACAEALGEEWEAVAGRE